MKLFIAFVMLCFMTSTFLQKHSFKLNAWAVFGIALLVSIGYLFFNQI